MAKGKQKKTDGSSTIALNKKAGHEYFIEQRIEAGLVLEGWEVKSLRAGRVQLKEGYVKILHGEAFLIGAHISALAAASTHVNPDPTRSRKLLLKGNYEITHGMVGGRDYEIVAVIHSGGGRLALKNTGINGANVEVTGRNAYEGAVKALMSKGVKFYFCQNTTRAWMDQDPISFPITSLPKYDDGEAAATDQIIPGMLYTTAGLTSIADFQAQGYQYIQP